MTSTDITAFDEYLEENHKRNREQNNYNISKAGLYFDPLTDQEPDTNTLTDRLAEKVNVLDRKNSIDRTHTKKPKPLLNASYPAQAATHSETSKAKGKRSTKPEEMEIITQTKTGIRLTCPVGHVWIFGGSLDRRYAQCNKCKRTVKLPKQGAK
jgi:hypothetical protein